MANHFAIDGYNLLHALEAHAPVKGAGRETLVRLLEALARGSDDRVTLVFDGPAPPGALASQINSHEVDVRFSGTQDSADDVLIRLIHASANPTTLTVVTGDNAILHEAGLRRCPRMKPPEFIALLYGARAEPSPDGLADNQSHDSDSGEKPSAVSPDEAQELLDLVDEDLGLEDSDDFLRGI